jgi:hypothetical protein
MATVFASKSLSILTCTNTVNLTLQAILDGLPDIFLVVVIGCLEEGPRLFQLQTRFECIDVDLDILNGCSDFNFEEGG